MHIQISNTINLKKAATKKEGHENNPNYLSRNTSHPQLSKSKENSS